MFDRFSQACAARGRDATAFAAIGFLHAQGAGLRLSARDVIVAVEIAHALDIVGERGRAIVADTAPQLDAHSGKVHNLAVESSRLPDGDLVR